MEIIPYIWESYSIFTKMLTKITTNLPIFRPEIHPSIEIREKLVNGSHMQYICSNNYSIRYADLCRLGFISDPFTST